MVIAIIYTRITKNTFNFWYYFDRLGMDVGGITPVEREKTKRVVYAVIYGVGKAFHGRVVIKIVKFQKNLP